MPSGAVILFGFEITLGVLAGIPVGLGVGTSPGAKVDDEAAIRVVGSHMDVSVFVETGRTTSGGCVSTGAGGVVVALEVGGVVGGSTTVGEGTETEGVVSGTDPLAVGMLVGATAVEFDGRSVGTGTVLGVGSAVVVGTVATSVGVGTEVISVGGIVVSTGGVEVLFTVGGKSVAIPVGSGGTDVGAVTVSTPLIELPLTVVSGVRMLERRPSNPVLSAAVVGVGAGTVGVSTGVGTDPVPAGTDSVGTGAEPVPTGTLVTPPVVEDKTGFNTDDTTETGAVKIGRMPGSVGVAEAGSVPTALVGEIPGAVDESFGLLVTAVPLSEAG